MTGKRDPDGGGAVARRRAPDQILEDILVELRSVKQTDLPSDEMLPLDYPITAAAGELYVEIENQFGWCYIPNCPRDVTIYTGVRGSLFGSFPAGAPINFKIPRVSSLTIIYGAGAAAGTLSIWLSARAIEVNAGFFSPGSGSLSFGKIEDTPHVSGDVGIEMLGVRNSTSSPTVLTSNDGDFSPIATGVYGQVAVSYMPGTLTDGVLTTINAWLDPAGVSRLMATGPALFNGTSYDKQRANVDGTALASLLRTATAISADITNHNSRGVAVWLNVTAASGTGGLTVQIEEKDPVSASYKQPHANPTAILATGLNLYLFYPGINNAGNNFSIVLPRIFAIQVQHGDASNYTYSVGYSLIV